MASSMTDRKLDCTACGGTQTMTPQKVSKMSDVVRIIGWLIVIPSILGVLGAGLFFLLSLLGVGAAGAEADTDQAAMGLAVMMSGGMSACVAVSSLISGLIGYLLIMKKKVWKCQSCGYHIDRD